MIFGIKEKSIILTCVLLAIATNIHVLLMAGFVAQGHTYYIRKQLFIIINNYVLHYSCLYCIFDKINAGLLSTENKIYITLYIYYIYVYIYIYNLPQIFMSLFGNIICKDNGKIVKVIPVFVFIHFKFKCPNMLWYFS